MCVGGGGGGGGEERGGVSGGKVTTGKISFFAGNRMFPHEKCLDNNNAMNFHSELRQHKFHMSKCCIP